MQLKDLTNAIATWKKNTPWWKRIVSPGRWFNPFGMPKGMVELYKLEREIRQKIGKEQEDRDQKSLSKNQPLSQNEANKVKNIIESRQRRNSASFRLKSSNASRVFAELEKKFSSVSPVVQNPNLNPLPHTPPLVTTTTNLPNHPVKYNTEQEKRGRIAEIDKEIQTLQEEREKKDDQQIAKCKQELAVLGAKMIYDNRNALLPDQSFDFCNREQPSSSEMKAITGLIEKFNGFLQEKNFTSLTCIMDLLLFQKNGKATKILCQSTRIKNLIISVTVAQSLAFSIASESNNTAFNFWETINDCQDNVRRQYVTTFLQRNEDDDFFKRMNITIQDLQDNRYAMAILDNAVTLPKQQKHDPPTLGMILT
jgi:hypothetical protein